MRYKTPIEIRQSQNVRIRTKLAEIPTHLRCRIPKAEWQDKPESFCRMQFIEETSTFIKEVYGIEPEVYQYLVWLLSLEVQCYIDAKIGFKKSGSQIVSDNRENPWLRLQMIATKNIIRLSRELGMTPASRLPVFGHKDATQTIFDVLPFG
jgi:phage terminase small subunit